MPLKRINVNEGDMRRIIRKLTGVEAVVKTNVVANQLNEAMREVREQAVSRAQKEIPGFKVSKIRSGITIRSASAGRLEARVDISRKPNNLIEYGATQNLTGVVVTLKAPRVIPHAFITKSPKGHRLVFIRVGKSRLPLKSLVGPSVGGLLKKHADELLAVGRRNVKDVMEEKIHRALNG